MTQPAPHPTATMSDADLLAELDHVLRKRLDTVRHGSDSAIENSTRRQAELEGEYLRRFPQREVEPQRLRPADSDSDSDSNSDSGR